LGRWKAGYVAILAPEPSQQAGISVVFSAKPGGGRARICATDVGWVIVMDDDFNYR
jgi:hypothetical protein